MISKAERRYIVDGVNQDLRSDGRTCMDVRSFVIETGVLPSSAGSCRVCNDQTDLVVAIKCEMTKPAAESPALGDFVIEIELSPSMVGDLDPRDVETMETELSHKAQSMLAGNGVIDRRKLCVLPGHFCWKIYADVMVFNGGGNLLDAISVGVRAAALTAALPRVSVVKEVVVNDEEDGADEEAVPKLTVEEDANHFVPIPDAANLALCLSCAIIDGKLVADPSEDEELCAEALLTAAVGPNGDLVGLNKSGGALCPTSVVARMVKRAAVRGRKLNKAIDEAIRRLEQDVGKDISPGAPPRWGMGVPLFS